MESYLTIYRTAGRDTKSDRKRTSIAIDRCQNHKKGPVGRQICPFRNDKFHIFSDVMAFLAIVYCTGLGWIFEGCERLVNLQNSGCNLEVASLLWLAVQCVRPAGPEHYATLLCHALPRWYMQSWLRYGITWIDVTLHAEFNIDTIGTRGGLQMTHGCIPVSHPVTLMTLFHIISCAHKKIRNVLVLVITFQ